MWYIINYLTYHPGCERTTPFSCPRQLRSPHYITTISLMRALSWASASSSLNSYLNVFNTSVYFFFGVHFVCELIWLLMILSWPLTFSSTGEHPRRQLCRPVLPETVQYDQGWSTVRLGHSFCGTLDHTLSCSIAGSSPLWIIRTGKPVWLPQTGPISCVSNG